MYKVIVKNLQDVITHGGQFPTNEEAQLWVDQESLNMSWGKPAGFYPLSSLSESELLTEISRILVDEFEIELVEPLIEIPNQFSVEIVDITEQVEFEQKVAQARQNQERGAQIIAHVAVLNESLFANGSLTVEQFKSMMSDTEIAFIRELLWTGSITTAKTMIQILPTTYYTSEQIQEILDLITTLGY